MQGRLPCKDVGGRKSGERAARYAPVGNGCRRITQRPRHREGPSLFPVPLSHSSSGTGTAKADLEILHSRSCCASETIPWRFDGLILAAPTEQEGNRHNEQLVKLTDGFLTVDGRPDGKWIAQCPHPRNGHHFQRETIVADCSQQRRFA